MPSLADCLQVETKCVGLNLRRADRVISQHYDAAFRKFGLKNTQFGLLVAVRAMQPVPLARLAHRIDLDRTTLTRNIGVLEKAGLIETSRGTDLRERILTLTEKGTATLGRAFPAWKEVQLKLEQLVGEPAVHSLIVALKKVAAVAG